VQYRHRPAGRGGIVSHVDTDPSNNVVVFRLWHGREEHRIGHALSMAEDSVRQAWHMARREHGARAEDVVELLAEWEPSAADRAFIERTFPGATVGYTFPRPNPGQWQAALDAAHEQLMSIAAERLDDRIERVEREGELLPVLWSESSPQADMLGAVPHYTLVPDGLHVSLAMVAPTQHGRIGVSHLTHHQLGEDDRFEELYETACANLASGLRIDEYEDGVLDLHRDGGVADAAVCLRNFHSFVGDLLGADRFVAGVYCPQHVLLAAESSPQADTVRSMIMESEYPTWESVPCLLRVDRRGVSILAERPSLSPLSG
jgi:hypothetical protein